MRNLREMYALAVCFVTLTCAAITLGVGLYAVVGMAFPTITMNSYEYVQIQQFNSNAAFSSGAVPFNIVARSGMAPAYRFGSGEGEEAEKLSDEDIERIRERRLDSAIRNERRSSLQSLIRVGIILLVSGTLFFLHWRLAGRVSD